MIYYTYAYLDPRKPGNFQYGSYNFTHEPFYIGKGSGRRKFNHVIESQIKRSNDSPKIAKILKLRKMNLEPIIIEWDKFETEEEAYSQEMDLIKSIGSEFIVEIKDGPLTNMILDGTTPPNHKNKTYLEIYKTPEKAEEQRRKRHEKQLAVGGFFKGHKHQKDAKDKISTSSKLSQLNGGHHSGHKHNASTFRKWKISRKMTLKSDAKKYIIENDIGVKYYTCNLLRFCKYFSISAPTLRIAFDKKRIPNRGKTKGWSILEKLNLTKNDKNLKRCIFIKI